MTFEDKKKVLALVITEQECDDLLINFLARQYKTDPEKVVLYKSGNMVYKQAVSDELEDIVSVHSTPVPSVKTPGKTPTIKTPSVKTKTPSKPLIQIKPDSPSEDSDYSDDSVIVSDAEDDGENEAEVSDVEGEEVSDAEEVSEDEEEVSDVEGEDAEEDEEEVSDADDDEAEVSDIEDDSEVEELNESDFEDSE